MAKLHVVVLLSPPGARYIVKLGHEAKEKSSVLVYANSGREKKKKFF